MTHPFLHKYPHAQTLGAAIQSIVDAVGEDTALPYLTQYESNPINPQAWYDFSVYHNTVQDILNNEPNILANLVTLGMHLAEMAPVPPEVDSVEAMLQQLPEIWQTINRDAGQGWHVEVVADGVIRCTSYSPLPKDLEYGAVYGFARKVAPGCDFTVKYEHLEDRDDPDREGVAFIVEIVC